jgi:ubiquinone/menaquinone biosynthesis C-methylase UbiE
MEGYTLGHTARDPQSREAKANKIIKVLGQHRDLSTARVLDIGTGAGLIANALSKHAKAVDSIDIVDDRTTTEGYTQTLVTDERIPFPDGTFDVVITNQVLEHVPDAALHLKEIRRVLADDGVVYLATPNKWWLTDPHYKLPFISWLPRPVAGHYLKVTKHKKWDIYSVSLPTLENLAAGAGFTVEDETMTVMLAPEAYDVKFPEPATAVLKKLPGGVRRTLLYVVPTHIKVLAPKR